MKKIIKEELMTILASLIVIGIGFVVLEIVGFIGTFLIKLHPMMLGMLLAVLMFTVLVKEVK